MDQWRLPPEVTTIGGTITVRATSAIAATGGIVRETQGGATATASGGGTAIASAPSPSVHVEAGLNRTQWDMACTSFGLSIGGVSAGKGGAFMGGVVGYFWGRRQWPES